MELTVDNAALEVVWPDAHRSTFHAVWLRDNCPCPECRHPSGQRLVDTRTLGDVGLSGARADFGRVAVTFDDGHASELSAEWLRAHCYCADELRAESTRRLWDASLVDLPTLSYPEVTGSDEALRRWLAWVDELGFAILTGGPTEPGTVVRVAQLFGYVRETNYGRLFDVRSVVNPSNLAFTGLGLGAHTDNPYRDPTPTLQLLHCLSSSAAGGENTLVDSFRVVQELTPAELELLATYPIRFRYSDGNTDLETEVPVISRAPLAVHYNTRSAQPFRLPPDVMPKYYAAYQRFGRLLDDDRFRVRVKLDPGDLFIVDNLRVLHGRTGYAETGERHLQGCYADRDGLRSKLAVLSR
jgi:gamma-butyrobetaine dioxygenase